MKNFIVSSILFLCFVNVLQASLVDSLKQILPTKTGSEKALVLCQLCYEMKYQDAVKARTYCTEALDLSIDLSFEKGKGLAYQSLGSTYEGQGDFATALRYQEDALSIFEKLNDTLELANTFNNMGIVFDQKGEYQTSVEYYFSALRHYEELNYKQGIARASNNIGIVYKKQGDYPKVIEYYKKALSIYESLNHGFGIAATKCNIGAIYLETKDYPLVIDYSEEALHDFDSLKVKQFTPYVLENMGLAYGHLNLLDKSKTYHEQALTLYQEYGNKKETAYTLNSLANIAFKQKQPLLAKDLAKKSLDLAIAVGAKEEIRNANLLLSQIAEQDGDFQLAHRYHKAFVEVKDSLFEIDKTERIAKLQTQFDTEKKERENLRLKSENQIQELTIGKKQSQLVGMGIGAILLLLIGSLLFRQSRLKQRETIIQKDLEFKEQAIQLSIKTQEEERKRIAKDLHDGIGQQLSGLKMAWQQLESKLSGNNLKEVGQLQQLTSILDEATNDVRNISHQMMPRALQEYGMVPALEDMINKAFSNTDIESEFMHYKTQNRYDESLEIAVYRIAQELVNNILKHAQATEVEIQLIENNKHLIFVMEDNGRGFDWNQLERKGHGLMNIQSRAQAIKGQIRFESNPGEGTIATLRIPLK